jgi:hypothetical protein
MRRAPLLVAVALLIGGRAGASTIVGYPENPDGSVGVGFTMNADYNLVAAESFTMNGTSFMLDSITLYLNGNGRGTFDVQLMDAIGPSATPANILLSRTAPWPDTVTPRSHAAVTLSGLNVTLAPSRTYYLVVTSKAGPGTGWSAYGPGPASEPFAKAGGAFSGVVIGGGVATYKDLSTKPATFDDDFDENTPEIPYDLSFELEGHELADAAPAPRR